MSKKGLETFLKALDQDVSLAEVFAASTARIARSNGYDVDERDVTRHFSSTILPPATDVTTMAVGEEDGPRRRALREDDGHIMPTEAVGEDMRGKITTMAVGEETKKPNGPRR